MALSIYGSFSRFFFINLNWKFRILITLFQVLLKIQNFNYIISSFSMLSWNLKSVQVTDILYIFSYYHYYYVTSADPDRGREYIPNS